MDYAMTLDDKAGQEWAEADYLRRRAERRAAKERQNVATTTDGSDAGVSGAEGVAGVAGRGAGGPDRRDRHVDGRGLPTGAPHPVVETPERWRSVMVCDGTFCYEDWELVDDAPEPPPFDDDDEPSFEFNWEGDDD